MQDEIDVNFLGLQKQIGKLGGGFFAYYGRGMVALKMKELQGPMHTGAYMKSPSFQALVFVKFRGRYARDLAVGILQRARSKHGAKNVGDTQAFPVPTRAQILFLMGYGSIAISPSAGIAILPYEAMDTARQKCFHCKTFTVV